jgi:hypothetical protein
MPAAPSPVAIAPRSSGTSAGMQPSHLPPASQIINLDVATPDVAKPAPEIQSKKAPGAGSKIIVIE